MPVPNHATGCQRAGGSPTKRSTRDPCRGHGTALDQDVHPLERGDEAGRDRRRRARRRGPRPHSPKLVQSRTTIPCGASSSRRPGRCTSTQQLSVSATVETAAGQRRHEPARRVGDRRRPRRRVGLRRQRLDDGEGEPVHRPPRLAGAERPPPRRRRARSTYPIRRPGQLHTFVSEPRRHDVGIAAGPGAGGERVERLVPDPRRGVGRGEAARRARRVRAPPGRVRRDPGEVPAVQRELRVDDRRPPARCRRRGRSPRRRRWSARGGRGRRRSPRPAWRWRRPGPGSGRWRRCARRRRRRRPGPPGSG